jgi:hypothetical protein
MGAQKGNPIPSYQNQAYTDLYGQKPRTTERSSMVAPVMLDVDTNISQHIQEHLKGNYSITSSGIIVNGSVRAEEYIVNIFSSSIIYSSGSTKFGDTSDDIHHFTGSLNVSGSTTFFGVHKLSGSNTIVGNTLMTGTNTIIGNTEMSGSIEVSGSSNFHNSLFIVTGSSYFTGSHNVKGNTSVTGSFDVTGQTSLSGSINVASGSSFYRAGNKLFNYGQWGSSETQSGSANTAYPMKLGTKYNGSEGVDIVNNASGFPTRIKIANTGLYNIQFSAQLANSANTNITFDIWFAYTGSNMDDSNTQMDVNKSAGQLGRSVAAWNLLTPIVANDYVEIMWSCNAATGQLAAGGPQTTPTRPAIPSVIATITQIA